MGRPLPREHEEADELALHVGPALTGGVQELERLPVVMHEDLRVIRDALGRGLLDPARSGEMLLRTRPAGNLLVGDIAHERVPERELLLPLDRRDAEGADELTVHELVQLAPGVVARARAHDSGGAVPEHPSDNGRVVEEGLELRPERVEPGRDERLHGLRNRQALDVSRLGEHAGELLRVERVPSGALEESRLGLRRQERTVEENLKEPARLLDRER